MSLAEVARLEMFRPDCQNWTGYKPCVIQRKQGLPNCHGCQNFSLGEIKYDQASELYDPELLLTAESIGIVEMGGLGSLLRTSCVVQGINILNPSATISWYTHTRGVDLLKYVPGVKAIDIEGQDPQDIKGVENLDLLLNFEMNNTAKGLALRARQVGGFTINEYGNLAPASIHAYYLQRLQIDDEFRKVNTKTMQQILLESIGLVLFNPQYHIYLPEQNRSNARRLLRDQFNDKPYVGFIGLNLGSSEKGRLKRWQTDSFAELATSLAHYKPDYGIAILGGPEDEQACQTVSAMLQGSEYKNIKVMNNQLEIGDFMAMIGNMNVIVTGDTFAFHAAKAQNIPLVALVGPMPHKEMEISEGDILIGPKLTCSPCYYRCSRLIKGECMQMITVKEVFDSVMTLLTSTQSQPSMALS